MPSSSFTKFQALSEELGKEGHQWATDSIELVLCAAANAPNAATDAVLADLTPITYTNLSTRTLASVTYTRSGAVSTLDAADHTLTASGGAVAAFRYLVFRNATSNKLIGYIDYGSDLALADGESLDVPMPAGGILTVTS